MASVAICPNCYLQLIVPDGVEPDEMVECPTCAKEFGVDLAVLRAIPEVVRRSRAAATTATAASDEVADIEAIKARIESEIATNDLPPGMHTLLPLELPADVGVDVGVDVGADAKTQAADGAVASDEAQVEAEIDVALEPREIESARPAATTLADLMPPREERGEIDEALGPSFDLPNVPLTPPNGATVEFDPSMSFGPAAETEFALDDVDFAAEAPAAAEADVAVFSEPEAALPSDPPLVLPGILRPKKKRSVVRTLVGTALGGVVGLSLGYMVLLYASGPEGDLLQVAQYLPTAVLPKSFGNDSTHVAETIPEPTKPDSEKSAAVPAGYSEEVKAPAESTVTHELASDERYGTEPSPLDEPAAEPIATTIPSATTPPRLLRGPTFTVDQLAIALEVGRTAQSGLVAGDLSDASVRRTKGMSYAKLCDLAEALTFVEDSPSVESEQAIEGADRLFRETLADAHTRDEVSRIAQIWIESPHRGHGGVFLAGTLSGGQIAGDVYEYELVDDDGGKFTLLMREPVDPMVGGSGRPVGVVGSIVERPAEQVAGYHGAAGRAIWVARAIPLD